MPTPMDLPTHLTTVTLLVSNMHCPSCVESITALLDPISSIKDLSVNLLLRSVTFRIDTSISGSKSPKSAEEIEQDVKKVLITQGGFQVVSDQTDEPASEPHETRADTDGWMYAFDFARRRQERKERRQAERRRQKHFERCDACRLGLEHPDNPPLSLKTAATTEAKDVAGYSATEVKRAAEPPEGGGIIKTTLSISGMSCASCTTSIHDLLSTNPDILEININLLSSSGIVKHKSTVSAAQIREMIEDGGFEAEVTSSEAERGAGDAQADRLLRSVFSITGMTCASCSSSVDTAIRPLPGIKEVAIDVLSNRGTIVHYPSISAETIKEAIEDTGFDAELVETRQVDALSTGTKADPENDTRKVTIRVEGIFCNNCVTSLNAHLASLPLQSYTDFTSSNHTTTVTYKPHDPLDIRQILQGLTGVAPEFSAEIVKAQSLSDRSRGIQQREFRILAAHLIVAFIFAIPTFIIAIVGMVLLPGQNGFRMRMMKPIWGAANLGTIVLWPLVTIVQFGVGRLFYERTFHSLYPLFRLLLPRAVLPLSLRRTAKRPFTWRAFFTFGSMDLLVVLSTTTSYFASIAMLILDVLADPTSDSVGTYFDSCVFLIMFILLGRTLESYAKSKTTDSVSLLGQLRPETALLVEPDKGQGKQIANGSELEKSGISRTDSETDRAETDSEIGHTDNRRGPSSRAIPVEHLEIGDLILIPPGSLPPTDGIVVSGKTTFDESSLTGESRPVTKSPDDEIFTGTTNLTSAITVRVTRLGGSTMLEKIISAVSDASSRKAPLEKMAERLTGVFVPMIVYLALIVLAIWLSIALTGHLHTGSDRPGGRVFSALEFAIATLVVACPCGIGLAVPCANAVGTGLAAKNGILAVGGGEAFVGARKVGVVLLDKTGTITEGRSRVVDEIVLGGSMSTSVLKAVEEVERGSTHPLAQGLVEHLQQREKDKETSRVKVEMLESTEVPGRGLRARVKVDDTLEIELLIGNALLLADHSVVLDSDAQGRISTWSDEAKSVILVATTSPPRTPTTNTESDIETTASAFTLSAMFALSDPPRATSQQVISSLLSNGIRVMMLSGDNETTARAVGRMVGISQDDVKAGVGPEGKAQVIRDVQMQLAQKVSSEGKGWRPWRRNTRNDKVMFVGDGLNDSVALAAADVSVAMGHGSQSTLAGADFVLLNSSLSTLLSLLSTSRKVTNRQILNLGWAIVFNLVCLPFAAGVFYPAGGIRLTPVWSAVLMALSSVSVVCSSLALRWGL